MAASAKRQDQRFTITKNTRHEPPNSGKKEKERGALIPGNLKNPKNIINIMFIKIISKDCEKETTVKHTKDIIAGLSLKNFNSTN